MSSSSQKPSVAQTCNLLSQYFKENGRFANQGTVKASRASLENCADFFANIIQSFPEQGVSLSQMTIFYSGKVFVFNELPAEKAKEIMASATKAAAATSCSVLPLQDLTTFGNNKKANPVQFPTNSLQRFFEKRKDRAAARAPYQVKSPHSIAAGSPKPEEQSKYPGLVLELEGQSLKQIDLNY